MNNIPSPNIMHRFNISGNLPSLNEYINLERANKYKASKIKKDYTNYCAIFCKNLKIDKNKMYDIEIDWYVKDNRKDSDNIFFAVKFILDGMVKAKILISDGRKHIRNIHHNIFTSKIEKIIVKLQSVK